MKKVNRIYKFFQNKKEQTFLKVRRIKTRLKSDIQFGLTDNYILFASAPPLLPLETEFQDEMTSLLPANELAGLGMPAAPPTGYYFDPTVSGYTICQTLKDHCGDVSYLPGVNSIVFTDKSWCRLIDNKSLIQSDLAQALNVPKSVATQQLHDFFNQTPMLVQPTGLQGNLYKIGQVWQGSSVALTITDTIGKANAFGVSGLKVLAAQPYLAIAIPTAGGLFCYGMGTLVGGNTNLIGRSFNSCGWLLFRPMAFLELGYNVYLSGPIKTVTGLPTVLNMTKSLERGSGLDYNDLQLITRTTKTLPGWVWKHAKKFDWKALLKFWNGN